MSDKQKVEDLTREIAELTATVKEHNESKDRATIETPDLAETLTKLLDERDAAKAKEAVANDEPERKGVIASPVNGGGVLPNYSGDVPGFGHAGKGVIQEGKFAGHTEEDLMFVNWMLEKAHSYEPVRVKYPSKELQQYRTKALTATGAGSGDEYVPTGMAAQLWQDFFLQSKIVSAIGPMVQPTDPFDMPVGWGQTTWFKGTANTAVTATDPTTAKSTLTSTEQVTEFNWSYDLDEDSIIAILPTLRAEVSRDGAEQMDKFVLNADATNAGTGNINLDDADPDDDSYYLSNGQDGIRHQYIVDDTGQSADISAALTDALLRAGIAKLEKYGADIDRLVMVTDAQTYLNNMLGLSNVVTVDKYGPTATVLTGELSKYSGISIIVSGAMARAEDDGKVSTTGSNNDEGQIAIFHRDMWKVAFKRQLTIELDRNVQKRQFLMVISFRIAVAARPTRSDVKHTAGVHGIVLN